MTPTATEFVIRRIVVALDPSMPCRAALIAATELASVFKAELTALVVEDINLVRWAGLPNALHFPYISGRAEPLDVITLRRGLRVQAARLRQLLEMAAQRAHVRYSVHEVQGHVTLELLEASKNSDLLIVGRTSRTRCRQARLGSTALAVASRAPQTVLLLQRGRLADRPLIAVYDGSPGGDRTLFVADRLLRELSLSGLTVLLLSDPSETTELVSKAKALLLERNLHARLQVLEECDVDSLATCLRSLDGIVIVDKDTSIFRHERIEKLLDQINNPVFVVR